MISLDISADGGGGAKKFSASNSFLRSRSSSSSSSSLRTVRYGGMSNSLDDEAANRRRENARFTALLCIRSTRREHGRLAKYQTRRLCEVRSDAQDLHEIVRSSFFSSFRMCCAPRSECRGNGKHNGRERGQTPTPPSLSLSLLLASKRC